MDVPVCFYGLLHLRRSAAKGAAALRYTAGTAPGTGPGLLWQMPYSEEGIEMPLFTQTTQEKTRLFHRARAVKKLADYLLGGQGDKD